MHCEFWQQKRSFYFRCRFHVRSVSKTAKVVSSLFKLALVATTTTWDGILAGNDCKLPSVLLSTFGSEETALLCVCFVR